jgi:cobalt-zinc-cadmium resistance protein CzcA
MLHKIINWSISNKLIVGIMTLGLIIWGIISLTNLPIDAVPDITNNQVQIVTSSPSSGAEDIERFVTFPVEQTMATIPEIEEIRSFSRFGLSVVTIVFKEQTDIYWARQQVSERLSEAKSKIPPGFGDPSLVALSTGLGEIYQYIVKAKKGFESKIDATELRSIQDWVIRRQLLGVEGVADVSGFGGNLKQYEIAVNLTQLKGFGLTIADVFKAVEQNNQNTGGAYIEKNSTTTYIRTDGLMQSINDIEQTVVAQNQLGTPVLVKDIGKVNIGKAVRYGALTYNNTGEAVGGIVLMLKGANSSNVIKNVKERMNQIRKTLPNGVDIEVYLDRTKLVDKAISTVSTNLIEGALIVIFVLVLLLGNFRAGLIVASVIPLAMLFAISLMNVFGVSGNLMSLGALDFGLIIDGAVIIVESTLHILYLQGSRNLNQQEMDLQVFNSAVKFSKSAVFGQIIILVVYLPLLALVGIEGKMFRPMAQTVMFAIIGALILSLTYVPMISALFLSKKISVRKTWSDTIVAAVKKVYIPSLNSFLRNQRKVLIGLFVLFVSCILLFNRLGAEFIPSLDEGDFAVETRLVMGTSLTKTVETTNKISKILLAQFPEVKQVVGKIGTAEIPTDPMPMEACDLMIILKDKEEWVSAASKDELAEKMQATLENSIPGVSFGFLQPIQMRFNELMTGAKQDVVVKVYGEDLDLLGKYARKIGAIASKIEGVQDVYVEEMSGLPQLIVSFNRRALSKYNISIDAINQAINTSFAGQTAGLIFEGEKRFDLVVKLDASNRASLDDLKSISISSPAGLQVPLEELAVVELKKGPNQIQRDDAKRRIIVGFNVRGRDVASIVNELEKNIASKVDFEPGYYTTYGGTFKNLEAANARLSIAVPVALLLIFFLLYLTFQSMIQALLIFSAIPLAALGGILALWLRDMPFSISAGVGFIALFGVAVLNGIVLISEFNSLKKSGYSNRLRIVLLGTRVRLRPVLLTALVASLGFLPMALSHGSGAEVQKPLATVVIGGLITATLLTLFVLPIFYLYSERKHKKLQLKKKQLTTVILLFLPFMFFAQTKSYSLDQCLEKAKMTNLELKIASQQIEKEILAGKAAVVIPKTAFTFMLGQFNSFYNKDNSITIAQSLPFPTVFSRERQAGQARADLAKLSYELKWKDLKLRIEKSYNACVFLKEKLRYLVENDSVYTLIDQKSNIRYAVKDITKLDAVLITTKRLENQKLVHAVENQLIGEYANLAFLIGENMVEVPRATSLKLLPRLTVPVLENYNNHLMVSQIGQQIKVLEKDSKVVLSRAMPDFTIGYVNQTLVGSHSVNGIDKSYAQSDRFQSVQVGMQIPLFYGSTRKKMQLIQLDIAQRNNEKDYILNNLTNQYKQLVAAYQTALNDYQMYEDHLLNQLKLMKEQATILFATGEISMIEFLQTKQQCVDLELNYLETIKTVNEAIYQLNWFVTQ